MEIVLDRDAVDTATLLDEFAGDLIDIGVQRLPEVLGREEICDAGVDLVIVEQGAEHSHLAQQVVRAGQRALVEAFALIKGRCALESINVSVIVHSSVSFNSVSRMMSNHRSASISLATKALRLAAVMSDFEPILTSSTSFCWTRL
jgi:hypothetical protein